MTAALMWSTFPADNWKKLEEVDDQAGVKVEVAISAQITRVAPGPTV
jgi:hypothetical protein